MPTKPETIDDDLASVSPDRRAALEKYALTGNFSPRARTPIAPDGIC
jgi:hypothetical protein